MNNSQDEILQIINKNISLSRGNIFQLRKDFEDLYLKFSLNKELYVKKQSLGTIYGLKICAEKVIDDHAILFFHGGGFTTGSTNDHLELCGKLSDLSCVPVLSIDYRLVPEHKFPAAVEDCLISYL